MFPEKLAFKYVQRSFGDFFGALITHRSVLNVRSLLPDTLCSWTFQTYGIHSHIPVAFGCWCLVFVEHITTFFLVGSAV